MTQITEPADQTAFTTALSGYHLLTDPLLNKGTAFTVAERDVFGLHGLLPPQIGSLDEQVATPPRAISPQISQAPITSRSARRLSVFARCSSFLSVILRSRRLRTGLDALRRAPPIGLGRRRHPLHHARHDSGEDDRFGVLTGPSVPCGQNW